MATDYDRYLNSLPVIPDLAAKVLAMVGEGREFTFADLEGVIARDPGLTAKVLQVANSSLYARPREVTRLAEAITLLGLNTLKSLVILVVGSRILEKDRRWPFYQRFWRESLESAFWAKELALRTGQNNLADEAFVAALLKDIGRAALFASDPSTYQGLADGCAAGGLDLEAAERQTFGVSHQEVGAGILDSWNFPSVYCDTAREHGHAHITSPHKRTIVLVTVASYLAVGRTDLEPFLPFLGLGSEVLRPWADEFRARLDAQPLYTECRSLFQV